MRAPDGACRVLMAASSFTVLLKVEDRCGEEALEVLRYMTPSVAPLDIKLPGMDGFTTCQRIREMFDFPIIMVTAMAQPDERFLGIQVGADRYRSKPFLPAELVAQVNSVLRRYNY